MIDAFAVIFLLAVAIAGIARAWTERLAHDREIDEQRNRLYCGSLE